VAVRRQVAREEVIREAVRAASLRLLVVAIRHHQEPTAAKDLLSVSVHTSLTVRRLREESPVLPQASHGKGKCS